MNLALQTCDAHRPLSRTDARRVPRTGIPKINMRGPAVDYFNDLQSEVTDQVEELVRDTILRDLEFEIPEPDAEDAARGVASRRFERRLENIEARIERLVEQARGIASRNVIATSQTHREQTRSQLSAIGISVFRDSPQLEAQLRGFTRVNTRLITSIPVDELTRIEAIILEGVRQGRRHEAIAADIEREFEIAENRARLIARDQVGTIAADLSRSRMTANGVTRGVWRTAEDERVRSSHAAREGRSFALDRGIQGDLPGSPINCRCYTEPHL